MQQLKSSKTLTVKLDKDGKVLSASPSHHQVQREGTPLGTGFIFTDYFVQGMSFGSACWIVHLTPPLLDQSGKDRFTFD